MIALALGAGLGLVGALVAHAWVIGGGHRRAGEVGTAPVGPWAVVAVATVASAVVATRMGGPLGVAGALYAVGAVVVSWVDLDVRRVPNAVLVIWAPLLASGRAGRSDHLAMAPALCAGALLALAL